MGSFFSTAAQLLGTTYSLVLDRRAGKAVVRALEAGLDGLRGESSAADNTPELVDQLAIAEQVLAELKEIFPVAHETRQSPNLELDLLWPTAA
jgi:hypothetical protein